MQKASANDLVPPDKKYKKDILAEIVNEIREECSKQKNSYGMQEHIIMQHKKRFPCLNKNLIILGELILLISRQQRRYQQTTSQ